ncbi:MAG TPA: CAAX prenyl protease-related protein [Phycisphaerae bacterium]|nr:CAAX prenyl protease-related protein [Phycisphaerae bacterium]HNU46675.1 CAAX prenyl protease-related protein [Phycisphaerae bacterium]
MQPDPRSVTDDNHWIDRFVRAYPHAPLVAPFLAFLVLMTLDQVLGPGWRTYTYAARCGGGLYVAWLFRRHFPPLGRPHLHLAVPLGVLVAVGWVEVHHLFAGCSPADRPCALLGILGIEHRFPGFAWYRAHACFDCNPRDYFVPVEHFAGPLALWAFLLIRIGGAAVVVPIVEELFWRGFLLRALVNWHRFEEVPLGKFTLFSFLATALLSGIQHQPQWEVGILCWMVYNAVFYWKRSLACCMVMHGVTNLALYVYVYYAQDWRFW